MDHLLAKIVVIGNSGVGKTQLLRTLEGNPHAHAISTIGIEKYEYHCIIQNCKVRAFLWDTAG